MSPPRRVGMLLDKTFPPDPRVANEARSLVRAGHEVHLLCLRHNQQSPAREMWQGIHLHRLMIPRWFYRKASAVSLELRAYRWGGPWDVFFARSESRFSTRMTCRWLPRDCAPHAARASRWSLIYTRTGRPP